MAKKCGSCQKNKIANNVQAGKARSLRAAAQPISGGNAPGIAPTSVLAVLIRFSRREGGSKNRMEQRHKIHWPLPARVEAHRGREQDEKGKAGLYELGKVRHRPATFDRDHGRFDYGGLHFTLTAARPVLWRTGIRTSLLCRRRSKTAEMIIPLAKVTAPTAT